MRTRLAALVSAAVLAAAPLALAAAPAQAADCTAPQVLGTEVVPHTVVVGTKKVKGFAAFTDVRKNGCSLSSVKVTFRSPKHSAKNLRMAVDSTQDGVTSYVYGLDLRASGLENAEAGTWTATSVTRWSGDPITSKYAFKVLRASKLTANASPEPATAGKELVVTGHLTRASWESRKYRGYVKRHVQVQFRPTGGAYAKVATITSGSKGRLKKTLTATTDGCYRFVYAGSSTTNKATAAGDCVQVG